MPNSAQKLPNKECYLHITNLVNFKEPALRIVLN